MKGTFFNFKLRTLVAMFFILGGMLFSANRAEAQAFNWMNESQAMTQLTTEIEQLSLDLGNFVPGSTQYKNLYNHLNYYKLITVALEEGMSTADATNSSLPHVNDQFDAMSKFLGKQALDLLYADAVTLLTN